MAKKRSKSRSSRQWPIIIATLVVLFGGSLYLALTRGVGPLSFLVSAPQINVVATCSGLLESSCKATAGCSWKQGPSSTKEVTCKDCGSRTVTTNTYGCSKAGSTQGECARNGGTWKQTGTKTETIRYDTTKTQEVAGKFSCAGTPVGDIKLPEPTKPEVVTQNEIPAACKDACKSTTSTACKSCLQSNGVTKYPDTLVEPETPDNTPKTCGSANVPLYAGNTYPTGSGLQSDGKTKCTGSDTSCPLRECVSYDSNCNRKSVVCGDAYLQDPTTVILPSGGGCSQYTTSSAKDAKCVNAPAPCLTATGPVPTGKQTDNGYCFNGNLYKDAAELAAASDGFCATNEAWDGVKGICVPDLATPNAASPQDTTKCSNPSQVVRNNKCETTTCDNGNCNKDESCIKTQYGSYCQQNSNLSSNNSITQCNNSVLEKWDGKKWSKQYCQYGCSGIKCYTSPTSEFTYQSKEMCETNLSLSDTCVQVVGTNRYSRIANSEVDKNVSAPVTNSCDGKYLVQKKGDLTITRKDCGVVGCNPATKACNPASLNPKGLVDDYATKKEDCKYDGAKQGIEPVSGKVMWACPHESGLLPSLKPLPAKVVNASGKVDDYATKKEDCKYDGAKQGIEPVSGKVMWACPHESGLLPFLRDLPPVETNPKGLVDDYATNKDDCKYATTAKQGTHPVTGKVVWACPHGSGLLPALKETESADNREPYPGIRPADKKENDDRCLMASQCNSNYCDRSGFFVWNWKCADNKDDSRTPYPGYNQEYSNQLDLGPIGDTVEEVGKAGIDTAKTLAPDESTFSGPRKAWETIKKLPATIWGSITGVFSPSPATDSTQEGVDESFQYTGCTSEDNYCSDNKLYKCQNGRWNSAPENCGQIGSSTGTSKGKICGKLNGIAGCYWEQDIKDSQN